MGGQRRPVAEIEADAEELADWFENFDPAEATKVPVQEYLLECGRQRSLSQSLRE